MVRLVPGLRTELVAVVVAFCAFCWAPANLTSQEWTNPSERYADAHEKYLEASCPIPDSQIDHLVYLARDRARLEGHALLAHPRFLGAQIMYPWRLLEPRRDEYDFVAIREDLDLLAAHDKKLFVQLQDATFDPAVQAVPDYLRSPEFDDGALVQVNHQGEAEGWVAKRWNREVQRRFALLLNALGEEFAGELEGINLQETAIGLADPGALFSPREYYEAIKARMTALRAAFPSTTTMQYANFMPGEWLPWEDRGYLRGVYAHGLEIGVALGAPDLMFTRKAQLNHPLALMREAGTGAAFGVAVQDGNYIGRTGADGDLAEEVDAASQGRENLVPILEAFARDFLAVRYMFWVDQEPYFSEDVLPCLEP